MPSKGPSEDTIKPIILVIMGALTDLAMHPQTKLVSWQKVGFFY